LQKSYQHLFCIGALGFYMGSDCVQKKFQNLLAKKNSGIAAICSKMTIKISNFELSRKSRKRYLTWSYMAN